MKPICVPCQRFYRPEKNGFYFIECMPVGSSAPPGTAAPEQWKPYKLWVGDLWRCPGCGHTTVVGVNQNSLAEHYQPTFDAEVARFGASYRVNDC